MNQWLDFLRDQGALIHNNNAVSFGETPGDYPQLEGKALICPLTDRGVIAARGPDTGKLLQGQLTCDMEQLTPDNPLTGALCTVKGRTISNFSVTEAGENGIRLICHRGLVAATLETLKKYAVFYKTELSDESDHYHCLGMAGIDPVSVPGEAITFPVTGNRQACLVAPDQAPELWWQLAADATPAGLHYWQLLNIRDGLGEVRPETREEFIPQMLNLQATGAVNFRKGCYTGQEIVARMHYLGKLKRRMYHLAASAADAPAPGTPCAIPGKKANAGHVVLAEKAGQETIELLAVLTDDAAASPQLEIGDSALDIQVLPLPYSVQLKAS